MSSIFLPYRVLGLCSSDVPFIIRYASHSHTYYALVPIGESFNVYKLPKLTLVAISDPCPEKIRAFASSDRFVYAAAGPVIYVFRNSRYLIHKIADHQSAVTHLLCFSGYLASLDQSGLLIVRQLSDLATTFSMQFEPESFNISAMFCPMGYVNKLLLGSTQGPLQLWNVKSQKQLCWFKGFKAGIMCISQAPSKDVCAFGLSDGRVILHNIRYDSVIMSFIQDGGAVTAVCFRSDSLGLSQASNVEGDILFTQTDSVDLFMVSGSITGQVTCWQLKENGQSRSVGHTKNLHWERVNQMFCIPSGDAAGAMVTSGSDNSIKVSYFDRADGSPKTVYKRSGHFRPPSQVTFWPGGSAGGSLLLSAGQDSMLRIFSTFNEHLDKSLGRAYAPGVPDRRKSTTADRSSWLLPAISQLSVCANRAEDWDSVVAIHSNRRQATTWNFVNATRGKHWLEPSKFKSDEGSVRRLYKHTSATSVFITNCGNYVLLGYSSGDLVKFNLQSGLEQGQYGDPTAHSSPVVGVSVNQVNRQTASVAGKEVRFWSFHKRELIQCVELPADALFSRFNGESDTLAIALIDGPVVLFDVTHRRMIRRFPNPNTQQCVDLVISADGRWLISTHHGDPLIKTWDIVYGKLIDCFRVSTPVTSLALSPTGEYLATTHANCLGVYLWDNCGTYRRLNLQPIPDDYTPPMSQASIPIPSRSLVLQSGDGGVNKLDFGPSLEMTSEDRIADSDETMLESHSTLNENYTSPDQLSDRLVTLSGVPNSFLTSFLHLDRIRARNRNATAVSSSAKESLPFFLPVVETEKGLAWVDQDDVDAPSSRKQKRKASAFGEDSLSGLEPVPGLMIKLVNAKCDHDYDELMQLLKSLGPSALDLEIRLLAPHPDERQAARLAVSETATLSEFNTGAISLDRLHGFLRLLINRFDRNLDVDWSCVCLEMLLHRHGGHLLTPRVNSATSITPNDMAAMLCDSDAENHVTRSLFAAAVEAEQRAAKRLKRRVSRSICLIDFVRNPTTTLHF